MKKRVPLWVVYCDDQIVVFNKPSGMLACPDRYDALSPSLDVLAESEFGPVFIVHRIDKETSGLIVYARTALAHRSLSMQFENRGVEKVYHALVRSRPLWKQIRVDAPLVVDGDAQHRTIVSKRGKEAVTDFAVLDSPGGFSWIEARPKTGRTHQIRAHAASLDCGICCDTLYGKNAKAVYLSEIKPSRRGDPFEERPLLDRLALHAYCLGFLHPVSGEKMVFTAPYHRDMEAVRNQLRKKFGNGGAG